MKSFIKKIPASVGLMHPSLGVKISGKRKAEILLTYKKPRIDTFVETGTEFGTTIEVMKDHFKTIHSVEMDDALYQAAVKKYGNTPGIHLYHGDSAVEIRKIMPQITKPALFWLDAHAPSTITMDNSPIKAELEAILSDAHHHTILIDDARHFPVPVIRKMKRMAREHGYTFEIKEGLFRLT